LGHKNRLRSARGFTLVEVLVSLGIVSVALLAGIRATDNLANNSQRLVDVLLGQMLATALFYANKVGEIFLGPWMLQPLRILVFDVLML
jgi:prepilin-type N-terminal cleavage/methylation domain-containing protein